MKSWLIDSLIIIRNISNYSIIKLPIMNNENCNLKKKSKIEYSNLEFNSKVSMFEFASYVYLIINEIFK